MADGTPYPYVTVPCRETSTIPTSVYTNYPTARAKDLTRFARLLIFFSSTTYPEMDCCLS